MAILKKLGINAEIDDEMIPVIEELNKVGLKTIGCCSGHENNSAYISFDAKNIDVLISNGFVSINWKQT